MVAKSPCPYSLEQLQAITQKHGLTGQLKELPDVGYVNWVFLVGDHHVLRVCKPHIGCEDGRTEAVAVPVAITAGINTPKLLVFDESNKFIPTSYTIYDRVPGKALDDFTGKQESLPDLYKELGREIGKIHTRITDCPDPNNWLDTAGHQDPYEAIETALKKERLDKNNSHWLRQWADQLQPAFQTQYEDRFIHNDLHSGNTMITESPLTLTGVIDWGDAAWGDPALDFETMPVWAVPWALEGYREEGAETDEGFLGRLLSHNIACAFEWNTRGETPTAISMGLLVNMPRLLTAELPAEWQPWLPKSLP